LIGLSQLNRQKDTGIEDKNQFLEVTKISLHLKGSALDSNSPSDSQFQKKLTF
jgi:hypothetical protein